MLRQQSKGSLTLSGENQGTSVAEDILLDSGSGVTVISEAGVRQRTLKKMFPRIQMIHIIPGSAQVVTFGTERDITTQTCPIHLVIHSNSGEVIRITVQFVILPEPEDLMSWGQLKRVKC